MPPDEEWKLKAFWLWVGIGAAGLTAFWTGIAISPWKWTPTWVSNAVYGREAMILVGVAMAGSLGYILVKRLYARFWWLAGRHARATLFWAIGFFALFQVPEFVNFVRIGTHLEWPGGAPRPGESVERVLGRMGRHPDGMSIQPLPDGSGAIYSWNLSRGRAIVSFGPEGTVRDAKLIETAP